MLNDTVEGAELAFEIGNQILKKVNNKKIPLINYKINQGYKSLRRFDYKTNCKKYFQIILIKGIIYKINKIIRYIFFLSIATNNS